MLLSRPFSLTAISAHDALRFAEQSTTHFDVTTVPPMLKPYIISDLRDAAERAKHPDAGTVRRSGVEGYVLAGGPGSHQQQGPRIPFDAHVHASCDIVSGWNKLFGGANEVGK